MCVCVCVGGGGGGGGGGRVSVPPLLLQIFIKISRSKVSLGELHINPYHTLQKDSLYCPSSTILC